MERRIVGGESPNRTRRCVLDLEAHRHPAQARAPYPASTVLIMLDIKLQVATHARRLLIRFRITCHYIFAWGPPGGAVVIDLCL